jgi:acyl-CoA thioester hydrolase
MRIKLDFPDNSCFETNITVSISDINYGGHMGNDRFLLMMQEARVRWFQSLGFKNEKDIVPPVGIIVADAALQYKAEVFHGETITVELAIGDRTPKGFDLYYKLTKESSQIAALGKTAILFVNYSTRKLAAIPDEVNRLIN